MSVVEKLFLAAFSLIALYVFLNAQQAGSVIAAIGQNTGGLFGVLQGGNVTFPGGVTINRPNQIGGVN